MLRSAVAEAAAEHPADAHDLAALLQVDRAFANFPTDTANPQP